MAERVKIKIHDKNETIDKTRLTRTERKKLDSKGENSVRKDGKTINAKAGGG